MNRKKEIMRLKRRLNEMEVLLRDRTLMTIQKDLREAPGYTPPTQPHTFPPIQYVPIPIETIMRRLISYLKLNIEIIPSTQEDVILKKEPLRRVKKD